MSCCCTKTFHMCEVVPCDEGDLVLPGQVPADGLYILELEFLGDVLRKEAMLTAGDAPTFDKLLLNERYTYKARVLGPDGLPVRFTIDAVVYDCFDFTTKRCLSCQPTTSSSSASS